MKIAKYKYRDNVSFGHYAGLGKIIDLGSSFIDIFDLLDIIEISFYIRKNNFKVF